MRRYVFFCAALLAAPSPGTGQSLPSWNSGAARKAITDFVQRVTKEGGPDFVTPENRVAVFDNDGTLWPEQPMYFQAAFILDRVRELAPQHPDWKQKQPFKGVLEGDIQTALAGGDKALLELVAATGSGIPTEEYEGIVKGWLTTARHPRFKRRYTDLVYVPMLELMSYLRDAGFKTYIVSGGGVDFIRPWAERIYGIPREQVIGSSIQVKYEVGQGRPMLLRLPEVDFIDDKAGKPVAIHKFIGRRPIFAAGNSDGDLEMLQWTTAGSGPRLGLIVHHTDAEREWAYDRQSAMGRLDKALDEAPESKWVVIDMKQDWKVVYAFQK